MGLKKPWSAERRAKVQATWAQKKSLSTSPSASRLSTDKPQVEVKPVRPRGRPSTFTQSVADEICRRMAEGRSLNSICKADDMPSVSGVMGWLSRLPEFEKQYARACEMRAETMADEIQDIADDARNDYMDRINTRTGEVERVLDHEHVQRSKLRIDARKWLASKMLPKKYGDRIALDGEVNHTHRSLDALEQARRRAIGLDADEEPRQSSH